MDSDDEIGRGWLPPDDRIWRHPSELQADMAASGIASASPAPARRPRPFLTMSSLVSGAIGAGVTITALFALGVLPANEAKSPRPFGGRPATAATVDLTDGEAIAERARPSIVQLRVVSSQGPGTGSGVIFRDDGYVLTNAHVVETASTVVVVMANGDEAPGEIVGWDTSTDVAVVKVQGGGPFTPATLGSTESLRVGQTVFAIGSPLGLAGGPSMTSGVVSALGRQVENGGNINTLYDMVQTDAAIAPGSSGGALVNARGEVVGITTAIAVSAVGAEGLGFATPIEVARDTAQQLIETGSVQHAWLGMLGEDLDRATAERLDLPGGALVRHIQSDSPCERAGIVQGDIVVAVDHKAIDSVAQLIVVLRRHQPGDTVRIKLMHDGNVREVDVMLAARPN